MTRAVILSAVRTPIGRYGGALSGVRPDDLAAVAVKAAVERAGVDPAGIDDVYLGCANQAGEDNRDVARMAVLLAGLPQSVPGVTLNRLCASGLAAVVSACHAVIAGDGDLFVAGGVESMTRAPLSMPKPARAFERGHRTVYDTTLGWRYPNPRLEAMFPLESMGETGENVAEQYHVSREDQDAFALRSQQNWAAAQEAGRFADELIELEELDRDEHPRPDTTAAKLGTLKAAFRKGGSVTAGNSSGMNDGAAALVIASEERAAELGATPLAVFRGSAAAGVDPRIMGIGPIPAVQKLLGRTGVAVGDIDLVELNEAFASQSVAVVRELGHRSRARERERRGHRARPPAGDERRAPGGLARARAAAAAGALRPGHAVRRRGAGPGGALREGCRLKVTRTQVGIVGAGPAGLTLAQILKTHGIESVVLESRSREYCEQRIRAGVLEQGTVDLLTRIGAGERMHREGIVHTGVGLQFDGERHRIALSDLTGGAAIVIYGQTEVVEGSHPALRRPALRGG